MLVLAASLLAACNCGSSDGVKPDLGRDARLHDGSLPDLGVDAAPDRGADLRAIDLGADTRGYDGTVCGGSRKLSPTPLQQGTPAACGTACKEVLGALFLENRFEFEGDLITFIVTPVAQKASTYGYLELGTGKAWQIRPQASITSDKCLVTSTDGKQIASVCRRSFGNTASRREIVAVFDPVTGVERDVACIPKKASTFCPVLDLAVTSAGVVMDYPPGTGCDYQAALQPLQSSAPVQNLPSGKDIVLLHGQGDIVVWSEGNPSQGNALNAVAYDLVKKTKTFVDPSPRDQIMTRTDGRYIVWADSRHDPKSYYRNWLNTEIYRHDLQSNTTVRLTNNPAQQVFPDVAGKWVAWDDSRHDPSTITPSVGLRKRIDIYVKNVDTGKEYYLTGAPGGYAYSQRPKVDAGRVVYLTAANNRRVLNLVDLEAFAKAQKK
jgi:hypothetical protein